MRDMMIQLMREEIGNPNGTSRYGNTFFIPKDPVTKREKKFNAKSTAVDKINMNDLEEMDDTNLLIAYNRFMRRYCTWM